MEGVNANKGSGKPKNLEDFKMSLGGDLGIEDGVAKFFELNGHNSGFLNVYRYHFKRTENHNHNYQSNQEIMINARSKIADIFSSVSHLLDQQAINWFFAIMADVEFRGYYDWREKYGDILGKNFVERIDNKVQKILGVPIFEDANSNPLELELVTRDKNLQYKYEIFDKENEIRRWTPGQDTASEHGWWVIKELDQVKSRGMKLVPDWYLKFMESHNPKQFDRKVVQEYTKSVALDEKGKLRPSHFRVLMDLNVKIVDDKATFRITNEKHVKFLHFLGSKFNIFRPRWLGRNSRKNAYDIVSSSHLEEELCSHAMRKAIVNLVALKTGLPKENISEEVEA